MSDIDISMDVCKEIANRLHNFGEYDVVLLEGYSLWPFADTIIALRAALDRADADKAAAVEAVIALLPRFCDRFTVDDIAAAIRQGGAT